MLAKLFPATELPTRVGHIASVILRVLFLATEAVVFPGNLLRHVLAGRTTPPVVGLRTASPFSRTGQMQNVVAIRTGPNGLRWTHHIAANETLQLGGIQLPDEFLALRALGGNLLFKLLQAGPIPLIPIRTAVFPFRSILRSIVVVIVIAAIDRRFVSILIGPLVAPVAKTSTSSVSLPSSILLRLLLLRCSTGPVTVHPEVTIQSFMG